MDKFLKMAMGTNKERYTLLNSWNEKYHAYATDGSRVYRAKTEAEGKYLLTHNGEGTIDQVPDVSSIFDNLPQSEHICTFAVDKESAEYLLKMSKLVHRSVEVYAAMMVFHDNLAITFKHEPLTALIHLPVAEESDEIKTNTAFNTGFNFRILAETIHALWKYTDKGYGLTPIEMLAVPSKGFHMGIVWFRALGYPEQAQCGIMSMRPQEQ